MATAEYFGEKIKQSYMQSFSNKYKKHRPSYHYFLDEMNDSAKRKGLKCTNFTNPHGLSDVNNYSTCEEVAKISYLLLNIKGVKDIVSRMDYRVTINSGLANARSMCWSNTNKLLEKGFKGVKTGNTPGAKAWLTS